jgi:hypothetical protein
MFNRPGNYQQTTATTTTASSIININININILGLKPEGASADNEGAWRRLMMPVRLKMRTPEWFKRAVSKVQQYRWPELKLQNICYSPVSAAC